jgi:hypothetical protein
MLTDVSGELNLRVVGDPVAVDLQEIQRQPSWASALSLCANKSGLQDKLIAADVGVDNAVWSRFKTGQNAPSGEQLDKLMSRCGNEAPLFWLLLRRGYDPRSLRKLESETQRQLREAREALDTERMKVRVLTEALHGRASV